MIQCARGAEAGAGWREELCGYNCRYVFVYHVGPFVWFGSAWRARGGDLALLRACKAPGGAAGRVQGSCGVCGGP